MTSQSTYHSLTTPNGTKTHYTVSGISSGPLVFCLHGLGGSTETFSPLLPFLAENYHIVCSDSEGLGKTPLSNSLSFPRYVSDLHHLVSHVQEHRSSSLVTSATTADPVIIIGHSLGAIIALHYAASYPSKVSGLLLLGPGRSVAGVPQAQQRMRDLAALARKQGMNAVANVAVKTNFPADRHVSEAHKAEVWRAVAASDPEGYARTAEAVAGDDHQDPDYGSIKCPAVFVAGDGDMISPVQRSNDLMSLMRGEPSVVISNSGHQPILEDIGSVRGALNQLLENVNGRKLN